MPQTPTPPPYLVKKPSSAMSPFVFAAPHSGRFYPADFEARSRLAPSALKKSEDAFVDELFASVTDFGGTQLVATHARAFLDLNRADNELDPSLFTPELDSQDLNISHRVKAGLGLIPGVIAEGVNIYSNRLPAREADKRRDAIHRPYHSKLKSLLDERKTRYGRAYLIDCHSMPSEGGKKKRRGPDIVLGDSWGSACSRELTSLAEELFIGAGFNVRRNVPYSGGYSTVHYGNPAEGIEALQIEINRAIYMDEETQRPLPEFDDIAASLIEASKELVSKTMKRTANTVRSAAE
jgi:N-formylglutamate amidohydrolase